MIIIIRTTFYQFIQFCIVPINNNNKRRLPRPNYHPHNIASPCCYPTPPHHLLHNKTIIMIIITTMHQFCPTLRYSVTVWRVLPILWIFISSIPVSLPTIVRVVTVAAKNKTKRRWIGMCYEIIPCYNIVPPM